MRIIRILFGFILACLAAAATLILFVYTPAELASLPSGMRGDRTSEAGLFALVVTPHIVAFAALPALIGVIFAERRQISSWTFYVLAGIGIAVLGFLTQHFSEMPGDITILHNYALTAFLTAGFAAGLVYWFFSGRFARAPGPGAPSRDTAERSAPSEHGGAAPNKA